MYFMLLRNETKQTSISRLGYLCFSTIKSMELKHLGLNQRIILLGDPVTEL
jgi:hypothetical protein